MRDTDRRFAIGVFFDGFGTLLLGLAMYLEFTITMPSLLQEIGLVVILLAVVVQWVTGMYFIIPAACEQWRGD